MATIVKDFRGLRCPVPGLRLNAIFAGQEVKTGDLLEVMADCPTFEKDVKQVCSNWKKQVLKVVINGVWKTATIKV